MADRANTGHSSTPIALRLTRHGAGLLSRVAPELANRLLGWSFTRVPQHRPPARERQWLTGARRTNRLAGGREVVLFDWSGDGPPVLLVHGWAGRGSQLGAFAEPLLERGFSVVALDGPAHGASFGRHTNLIEFRDALRELMDDLQPAGVVAHSFGATATTLAFAWGASPCPAVFVAPASNPPAFLPRAAEWLGFPPEIAAATRLRFERKLRERWDRLSPVRYMPWMETPLLVAHDEADREVPFADGRQYAAAWPGARLRLTRDLGHRRILRDGQIVQEAADFLASAQAGRRVATGASG